MEKKPKNTIKLEGAKIGSAYSNPPIKDNFRYSLQAKHYNVSELRGGGGV